MKGYLSRVLPMPKQSLESTRNAGKDEKSSTASKITGGSSCPVCEVLGTGRFVDFDEDMHLPDEVFTLKIVISFFYDDDMRQCSLCGTYYRFHFETDNDIIQPTHTGEYQRIPTEKAEEMIRERKDYINQQIKEYKKKIHRVHKEAINGFSDIEKQIVDYLVIRYCETTSSCGGATTKEELVKNLAMDEDVIDRALVHMREVKVIEPLISVPGAYRILTFRV